MEIKDINDQLKLKALELRIEKGYKEKQKIRNQIQVLNYKKEIEIIKDKIKKIC